LHSTIKLENNGRRRKWGGERTTTRRTRAQTTRRRGEGPEDEEKEERRRRQDRRRGIEGTRLGGSEKDLEENKKHTPSRVLSVMTYESCVNSPSFSTTDYLQSHGTVCALSVSSREIIKGTSARVWLRKV